ncbi:MAG: ShlB/FhaC/HecB family hemolysin secretion/activation protein [Pseudomonadota bacterium]
MKALQTSIFKLCFILLMAASSHAYAQIDQATQSADPARAGERLSEQRLIPQGGPRVSVRSAAMVEAPEGAENIKFSFGGLTFVGVGIYTEDDLFPIYSDLIGQEISLEKVYEIANEITLKYRNDGYILTRVIVPPQEIDNGIVRLQAVEGFINNIEVQGDLTEREFSIINGYAQQISVQSALNIKELERQLLLINDLAGIDARTIIGPSQNVAGGADMLIIVERDVFEGSVGINNHGSRFLGPLQFETVGIFNSLFRAGERITVQAVAAPDEGIELGYGFLEYLTPIGRAGTTIAFSGSITDTDPGFTLSQFDVNGISRNLSVGIEHPFIRSRDYNVSGRLDFDWRNVDSKNNVTDTVEDRIRAVRAGVQADFLDNLLGVAVNTIDFEISQGLDILNASDEGDDNLTRAAGDPTFLKANLRVQRLQRVTNNINILVSGRAQIANNPLLSSEEFGLGGMTTVRGYNPSETVGDDGINGNIEVQYSFRESGVQLFGFVDSGTVWNQDATNSADKRESLTSTGLGVRLDLPMEFDAEFVAAQPLHRDIETQGDRDPQFFFSVTKSF